MSKGHRFNVGDIVTLKPGVNKYRATGQGCICEVLDLYQNDTIYVYVIRASEGAEDGQGERFSVDGSCFMYADALME